MSDIVTCTVVLAKSADRSRPDWLYLITDKEKSDWRAIPCRSKGSKVETGIWNYEELQGGKLRIEPSLHCIDTGFHTNNPWEVSYFINPADSRPYDYFFLVNSDIKKP